MRLKSIKLAGFKSFVDATTVPFPSNLSAIVGPNGCGKSNIIDAVRWVMGESSARYLRGESMADVIFNGSTSRKPVGQASIELIFDNGDGTLGGEYAQYAEIAVRRQVNRDGKSDYFLNSSRCRRKDITDIFLGTGLGPRSYAIIEQGMISRLIEARPEELRVYIEEAAGISRYKERRKETETRLSNTRDNLARLYDIREELTRQLSHLQKQADAAEKYRTLKTEERQTKIELLARRWQTHQQQVSQYELLIQQQAAQLAEALNNQQQLESVLIAERDKESNSHAALHEAQNRLYAIKNTISQTEQQIQYQQQRHQQLLQQQQAMLLRQQQAVQEGEQDAQDAQLLADELALVLPEQEALEAALEEQCLRLETAELALLSQQQHVETQQRENAQTTTQVQLWQNRIQTVEMALLRLQERQQRLTHEMAQFATDGLLDEVAIQQEILAALDVSLHDEQQHLEQLSERIGEANQRSQQLQHTAHQLNSQKQQAQGQESALKALQQAALGLDNQQQNRWLQTQQLATNARLAEVLHVELGFESLVETVLGDAIKAVVVEDLSAINLADSPSVILLEQDHRSEVPAEFLASKLLSRFGQELVLGVKYCASLPEALNQRHGLTVGESLITQDGFWLGKHWLKVVGKKAEDSVLTRQTVLADLQQRLEQLQRELVVVQESQTLVNQQQQQMEQERLQVQRQLSLHLQERGSEQVKLSKLQTQLTQTQLQAQRIRQELVEIAHQAESDTETLAEARLNLETHLEALQAQQYANEDLQATREATRLEVQHTRQNVQQTRQRSHQLALRVQSLQTRQLALSQNRQRHQQHLAHLAQQQQDIAFSLQTLLEPVAELRLLLESYLEESFQAESQLQEVKAALNTATQHYRQLELQRQQITFSIEPLRQQLEANRLAWQQVSAHQSHVLSQLQEMNADVSILTEQLAENIDENTWQQHLEQLANKITRLGAINLAAIDEYAQQAERKNYLDGQIKDLEDALEKLESAIKHIDKETRILFMDTFNRVNEGLQHLFPKVFGGGMASLQLVGEDTLTSGVSITARPPGKKNATIHLLSGGEKALTALALVFAIFQLNPAPFCLLDEVDAPLDDANVARFCRLVEEMAQQVQFIYITHNKIAMSMAQQLMGVTMHEPGVSRLVSVNVEQAAALAAA